MGKPLVYLDDVIVFGKIFEEHLNHLKSVMQILEGAGLKMNAKKCRLFYKAVKFLGHVSTKDVATDPAGVSAVCE